MTVRVVYVDPSLAERVSLPADVVSEVSVGVNQGTYEFKSREVLYVNPMAKGDE